MMKRGKVTLNINPMCMCQFKDDSSHFSQPHSMGWNYTKFPSKEFIKGFEYNHIYNPQFVYDGDDKHPSRKVKNDGRMTRAVSK